MKANRYPGSRPNTHRGEQSAPLKSLTLIFIFPHRTQQCSTLLLQLPAQPPDFISTSLNMAQGTVKKLGRATPAKITHSKRQASKVHKPKKTKASVDKVHKKFTSGMTARTEALLGERAGHLELLGQGKKKTDKKTTQKGGSKKFG